MESMNWRSSEAVESGSVVIPEICATQQDCSPTAQVEAVIFHVVNSPFCIFESTLDILSFRFILPKCRKTVLFSYVNLTSFFFTVLVNPHCEPSDSTELHKGWKP